ncbi:transposase [Streptomyces sp. NPDC006691]|uniref:transposase n=1 Tax=Streptomyces sp. NPDC006691 TaxID=3364757 RepID=UPI003678C451
MAMVERLVPDWLRKLSQRVVPAAPVRPQGGDRRRNGDRQVLAAIMFVATTGCTRRQLPPGFGPSAGARRYRGADGAGMVGCVHCAWLGIGQGAG